MVACNTTLEDLTIVEDPLWNNGLTFHQLGLIISAAFGLVSVVVALLLVIQHARHYSRPWEQKHIIRILLMIPIYSTVSFLSYYNYQHAIYYEVLRDCYEAFAIASFFTLLCNYIAPNLHDQKEFFRTLRPKNWFWGVFGLQKLTGGKSKGPLRIPRSGLTWFNVVWVSVFQYCFIRVTFTIVSVVTQYFDRYCEASLNPVFAHVWVLAFEAASVTVAMFCLIQFYLQLKDDLAPHRPFLKVLCIKLVIFFSFWQSLVISFISSDSGPLHPTSKLAYPDIKIGIPSGLLCVEMAIFSIMHIFAFSYRPYIISSDKTMGIVPDGDSSEPPHYQGGFMGIKALMDAFNPWDIVKASARGFRWLFIGRRSRFQDASYTSNPAGSPMKSFPPTGATTTAPTTETAAAGIAEHQRLHTSERPSPSPSPKPESMLAGRKTMESDRAGLLQNAGRTRPASGQTAPYESNGSPFLGYNEHDDQGKLRFGAQQGAPYAPPHGQAAAMPDASVFGGNDYTHGGGTAGGYHAVAQAPQMQSSSSSSVQGRAGQGPYYGRRQYEDTSYRGGGARDANGSFF